MGLFGRSRSSSREQQLSAPDIAGTDQLEVVGESFHAHVHHTLFGQSVGEQACRAVLVREPSNPHDANAIGVFVLEQDGAVRRQLGHLDRDTARRYCRSLDALGGAAVCDARLWRNDPSHVWSTEVYVDLDELGG